MGVKQSLELRQSIYHKIGIHCIYISILYKNRVIHTQHLPGYCGTVALVLQLFNKHIHIHTSTHTYISMYVCMSCMYRYVIYVFTYCLSCIVTIMYVMSCMM